MNKINRTKPKNKKWIYPLFLMSVLLATLLYIELKHPYFFFQDDNRDYYLPYIMHNYRSLLGGEIAFYNFYQALGIPSFSLGQSQVFYPLPYICVFASEALFGHYFATIDIIVIVHLLIGSLGMYYFVGQLTKSKLSAILAGLTWPLGSFVMYASNSWMIIAAATAYMPWMVYFTLRSYRENKLKNSTFAILARLMFFYSGHIQFFVYAIIFEFIFMMFVISTEHKKQNRKKEIIKFIILYIKQYIVVFFLALPVLLPMWQSTSMSYGRDVRLTLREFTYLSYNLKDIIIGLFYPIAKMRTDFIDHTRWMNPMNLGHIGYLPVFAMVYVVLDKYVFKKKRQKISNVKYIALAAPAFFAMLWASSIVIQAVVYVVPLINRFRWPFKLGLNMDFFLVALSAVIIGDIFARVKMGDLFKKIAVFLAIALHLCNFIVLYTMMPYKDFGEHHADEIPLHDEIVEKIDEGRVISINFKEWLRTPNNDMDYYTVPTLGFNYCMLFGIDGFAGYEQMMPNENYEAIFEMSFSGYYKAGTVFPLNYFRTLGVKYYLMSEFDNWNTAEKLESNGMQIVYQDETRTLYYDAQALPMVYIHSSKKEVENTLRTSNTLSAQVELDQDETIVFNYMYNPFLIAYVDGEKAETRKAGHLSVAVDVQQGSHEVVIKYEDPYFKWGCILCCGFALGLALYIIIRRSKSKIPR